jgi:ABC-2 type transport system ATP-binding protein
MSVEELRALPGVSAVAARDSSYHLTTREPHRAVSAVFAIIQERQGELTALSTHHATLDDVFLAQTGRQLRDE